MHSSGTRVMPTTTAPAARSRATTGWSAGEGPGECAREPTVITSPATATLSFTATGTPASGRVARSGAASTAAASVSAASSRTTRKAPIRASTAAICASEARTASTAVSCPSRTRAAISVPGRPAHPADAGDLPVPVQRRVEHGDTVPVGGSSLEVVHLRGHTPGSIALVLRAGDGSTHVFAGDSLFPGGVGNTQKDPERFRSLIDDVEARLFGVLPDDAWVYPGHGKDTTIGAERPHLDEWRARG